jgi:hypothetical protein
MQIQMAYRLQFCLGNTITVFRFQAIKAFFLSHETRKLMSSLGDI